MRITTLFTVALLPAIALGDETKPYVFRGVEPGSTTAEALRANARWGKPIKETNNADGSASWAYRPQGYKQAVVTVRGDVVQSVDVILPEGVGVDEAAGALKLGIPLEDTELPAAARVGATMPATWQPVPYSTGRVVLFVDAQRGRAMALRSFAGKLLDAAPAAANAPAAQGTTQPSAIRLRAQDARGREIIAGLARVFPQKHISGHPVDQEIASRTRQLFIDSLDPQRLYFNRGDVVRVNLGSQDFAAQLRQGDAQQLYDLYNLFLKRVAERRAMFDELILVEPDFTLDEQLDVMPYRDTWAENDLEHRETWRKRIKYELLTHIAAGATNEEARNRVVGTWRTRFENWQQFSDDDLFGTVADAFCTAYDPRSDYHTARRVKQMNEEMAAQLVGIGASLQVNQGVTEVVKVIAGSPAALDGRLAEGDRIVAVGEGDGELSDIVGLPLMDVVDRIRGAEGTVVRLRVLPKGGFEAKHIDLTRQRYNVLSLGSAMLGSDAAGRDGDAKIGYLYVPTMYTDMAAKEAGSTDFRSTARDLQKILDDMRASNVDVAVLDLRDNPGGALSEAIDVAALFVGAGPTLAVRDSQGRTETYQTETKPTVWDRPLVVLTNKGTSGGSEIVAAAVRDYGRGIVVGDSQTNGNGVIGSQTRLLELLNGPPAQGSTADADRLGLARISGQKFYRVNGDGIQGRGVAPEVGLPSLTEATGALQSELPFALTFDTVAPVDYTPAAAIGAAAIDQVAAASQQRRAKSEYFGKLSSEMQRIASTRNVITLNKQKFVDDRQSAQIDADAQPLPSIADVKQTQYLQEVFAIALDFAAQQYIAEADAAIKERRYADALTALHRAVAIDPQLPSARYRLAWSLATLPERRFRNGKEALDQARTLCDLDGRQKWVYLLTLAVAEAEAGNFEKAQAELAAALEKAPAEQQAKYAYLSDRFRRRQTFVSQ